MPFFPIRDLNILFLRFVDDDTLLLLKRVDKGFYVLLKGPSIWRERILDAYRHKNIGEEIYTERRYYELKRKGEFIHFELTLVQLFSLCCRVNDTLCYNNRFMYYFVFVAIVKNFCTCTAEINIRELLEKEEKTLFHFHKNSLIAFIEKAVEEYADCKCCFFQQKEDILNRFRHFSSFEENDNHYSLMDIYQRIVGDLLIHHK